LVANEEGAEKAVAQLFGRYVPPFDNFHADGFAAGSQRDLKHDLAAS